jgi:hypothetical protein
MSRRQKGKPAISFSFLGTSGSIEWHHLKGRSDNPVNSILLKYASASWEYHPSSLPMLFEWWSTADPIGWKVLLLLASIFFTNAQLSLFKHRVSCYPRTGNTTHLIWILVACYVKQMTVLPYHRSRGMFCFLLRGHPKKEVGVWIMLRLVRTSRNIILSLLVTMKMMTIMG